MSDVGFGMSEESGKPGAGGRRPKHHRRGGCAGIFALVIVVAILGGLGYAGFQVWDRVKPETVEDYAGPGEGEAIIVVEQGQTLTDIARTLAGEDVVASVQSFVDVATFDKRATSITPGTYQLQQKLPATEALEALLNDQSRYVDTVTLPEGLRLDETLTATASVTGIKEKSLVRAAQSKSAVTIPSWAPQSGDLRLEGFMFPATYELKKDLGAKDVLQVYVDRFNQAADEAGLEQAKSKVGVSPYEALIVASLIQAEARPSDYRKVSRVIYNRLNEETWGGTYGKLELDAALNYITREKNVNLTDQQRYSSSAYNLYEKMGLPPTPINSPGLEAIKAALNPAEGNWLWYVTVDLRTGQTNFTNNYNTHLENDRKLQRWCSDPENADFCR